MSSPVDRLNPKCLSRTSKIRETYRSIWFNYTRKIVWRLKSSSCYPIHSRGFDVDSRKMEESGKLGDWENCSIFGIGSKSFLVGTFFGSLNDKFGSSWRWKNIEARWELSRCCTCFPEARQNNPNWVTIRFEFALLLFSGLFFSIMMLIFNSWTSHQKRYDMCQQGEWKYQKTNPPPIDEENYFCKIRKLMIFYNRSSCMFSPIMVWKWWKINSEKSGFIFRWFREYRGNARKWINAFLLCTIFEICIELDCISWYMREFCFLKRNLNTWIKWKRWFCNLNITIVSIELTLKKLLMFCWCFYKKSNSTKMMDYKKSKLGTSMWKNMPPRHMRVMECIMESREHFTSHKNTLFIGSIHRDFEYHCIHSDIL